MELPCGPLPYFQLVVDPDRGGHCSADDMLCDLLEVKTGYLAPQAKDAIFKLATNPLHLRIGRALDRRAGG